MDATFNLCGLGLVRGFGKYGAQEVLRDMPNGIKAGIAAGRALPSALNGGVCASVSLTGGTPGGRMWCP
jgi:hypothetical protein